MSLKKGDLAIVVKSTGLNLGKIVELVSFAPNHKYIDLHTGKIIQYDSWKVAKELPTLDGRTNDHIPIHWLKKIEGPNGEDEMLRITGKPKQKEHV